MKDEFTTAYTNVIENQVEMAATIEATVGAAFNQGHALEAEDVLAKLDALNSRVSALAQYLSEQCAKRS
ncbi:hypothetical protein [Pseudomonas sp. S2_H01]